MKAFPRSLRVADQIHKEVSKMFLFEINDPRLKQISITSVKLSPDMSIAKIYFVTHEFDKSILEALKKTSGFIRKNLSKILILRKVPEIFFYYDEVFEKAISIDKILYKIKAKESDENE